MNPTEFAWTTLQTLAHKEPKEVKLIVDNNFDYPILEKDSRGFVLKISGPKKPRENILSLHGMFFDADQKGRASLWRLFRSSVYHLSLHSLVTDYSIYRSLSDRFNLEDVMFAASLAEDYEIRGLMRAKWPGLLVDTAYANFLSSLRFRELSSNDDLGTRIAANLLSYSCIGTPLISIGAELDQKIESAHLDLLNLERNTMSMMIDTQDSLSPSLGLAKHEKIVQIKISAATKVAALFDSYLANLRAVHTLPYTDNHGTMELFLDNPITSTKENLERYRTACRELSIDSADEKLKEYGKQTDAEAQNILDEWEYSLEVKQRIVDLYKDLDPKTHFENIIFPSEDYAEFVRTRSKLIGPIRRVLEQLRMIKSAVDEVQAMESGYVDIPAAIQVVATKSARNDVFIREEFDKKSEAWAILVDSSKSLESVQGESKDILVCLSEVAKDLMPNPNSWACYSFNENFLIVKDFSELYRNTTKGRIGALKTGVKTYLPDAIRMAARRLSKCTEDIKVLLVASDGFPLGYEGIDEELLETVDQVTRSGILMIGLGVGSSSIKKYFQSNCVINSPYDLMKHFVKTYLELSSLF